MTRARCIVSALLACTLVGCGLPSGSRRSSDPFTGSSSTPQAAALATSLEDYVDLFSARVAATADDIAAATEDREVREMTLRWKLRAIPSMRVAAGLPDPRRAYLDAWFLTVRLRAFFDGGQGAEVFGPQQAAAVDTMRQLEARVEALGRQFLAPEDFAEAEKELDALVAGHPIGGRFAADLGRASGEVSESTHPGLFSVLSIQLTGLKEGAEAVNRMAHAAGLATDMLAALPEEARWQLELTLLEVQRLEQDDAFLRELAALRASADAMTSTAAGLPAELRAELERALRSSEGPLAEARTTAETLRGALSEADALTARADATMVELRDAAVAWRATATEVRGVMDSIAALSDTGDASTASDEPSGWSFTELARAGDSVGSGAKELRSLLDELESERTESRAARLGALADGPIERGSGELRALVDRAAILGGALLVALLVGLRLVLRHPPRGSS